MKYGRIKLFLIKASAWLLIKQCHAKGLSLKEHLDSIIFECKYDEDTRQMWYEQIYSIIGEKFYSKPAKSA